MHGLQARATARCGRDRKNPFLFRYSAGDSTSAATFSRASTATYTDSSGLIQTAASGAIRGAHYIGGARYTLLEGQRTNLLTYSDDLSNAAWSKGNAVVSGDTVTFSGSGEKRIHQTVTASESTTYTFSVTLSGEGTVNLGWYDGILGDVARTEFTLTATPTRHSITVTTSAGATTLRGQIDAEAGATTMEVVVEDPQLEAGSFASSYIPTGGSTVTRAADSLSFPFPFPPQEMSVYVRGIFHGGSSDTYVHLIDVGSPPNRLTLWTAMGQNINTDFVSLLDSGTSPLTADAQFEAVVRVASDGGLSSIQRINGGTDESSTGVSGAGFPGSWSAETLRVNGSSYLERTGFVSIRDILIARGTRDLALFRNRIAA